ncbi:M23 family metallopeptidase [Hyphomonas johnsonii]|uniref:M23 family peptidase n=1 Tax=Hyphomonas johnsonii MHS-2 TaxID=1280950 RepID=A0A059FJ66_9PROT|nr:M23 family metallopeptidase [Hyphomonas johnsonii]KCZ90684.1 M23 family peptidase [Hyphomonas johnsonii MHS-2]
MTRFVPAIFLLLAVCACATAPAPVVYGPPGDPGNPVQGPFQPNAYLQVCGGMSVSNAPVFYPGGWVADFKPVIVVDGVVLVTVPTNDACLSSGFGYRGGRLHEGIDLTHRPAGTVYAAAPGRVVEARMSTGYGLQVLIDHGRGVYTRYAHLAHTDTRVRVGQPIGYGQPIGVMGQSGNATAIHLHYEILTGNYRNPKGSKGLSVHDPFRFPAYEPALTGY